MSNEVALIEEITPITAPDIYGHDKLGIFYQKVVDQVSGEVPDVTTKKGRDRIASLAAKVSSSKKAVENPGREYLKALKEMPKTIEAELRDWVNKMDALRDETRRPLTEWENAEKARIENHKSNISQMVNFSSHEFTAFAGLQELSEALYSIEATAINESWEEFEAEAAREKDAAINRLKVAIANAEKLEAERAELERLRAEQAAKEQAEREARIAYEAAERAKLEAQQEAERREAAHKAEIDRIAREKAEAEAAALRREQAAREEQERRERQHQEEMSRAAEAERQRIANEQAMAQAEALRREKDIENRKRVNNEVLEDFISSGLSAEMAKLCVKAIVIGRIRNIRINY